MTKQDRRRTRTWAAKLLSNMRDRLGTPEKKPNRQELERLINANPHWFELSRKTDPGNPIVIDLVGARLAGRGVAL